MTLYCKSIKFFDEFENKNMFIPPKMELTILVEKILIIDGKVYKFDREISINGSFFRKYICKDEIYLESLPVLIGNIATLFNKIENKNSYLSQIRLEMKKMTDMIELIYNVSPKLNIKSKHCPSDLKKFLKNDSSYYGLIFKI
jgi:hypothetical protein